MTQSLIKKQIKTTILFKAKVDRLITLNDNDFSQSLKSFKNFSNESIVTNLVIQRKFFVIKIIEIQFDKYEDESYDKYVKYVKQMKFQFNQNDVEQYINESNRKKIDYVMIFLKDIVENNWDAKKLINSRRVYTWDNFKKVFKNCIDKAKTLYANIYNKWLEYTQYDNQNIKSYNEKRIHYIFILFKTFKFIVEQKFEEFEKNLKKQHKKDLKYFFKFANKIDLIAQVKRFENQTKREKQNNKKNRKHKKDFDIFEFEFEQKKFKNNKKKTKTI